MTQPRAFLSYRLRDRKAAASLYDALEARGVKVYKDNHELAAQPLHDQLARAIADARVFVALIPLGDIESDCVMSYEIGIALATGCEIVPVLHEGAVRPAMLADYPSVPFSDPELIAERILRSTARFGPASTNLDLWGKRPLIGRGKELLALRTAFQYGTETSVAVLQGPLGAGKGGLAHHYASSSVPTRRHVYMVPCEFGVPVGLRNLGQARLGLDLKQPGIGASWSSVVRRVWQELRHGLVVLEGVPGPADLSSQGQRLWPDAGTGVHVLIQSPAGGWDDAFDVVKVQPLNVSGAVELLRSLVSGPVDETIARRVAEAVGGAAGALMAVGRKIDKVVSRGGRLDLAVTDDAMASLHQLCDGAWRGLSKLAHKVLRTVAASSPLPITAHVLELAVNVPAIELETTLDRCRDAGLLSEGGGAIQMPGYVRKFVLGRPPAGAGATVELSELMRHPSAMEVLIWQPLERGEFQRIIDSVPVMLQHGTGDEVQADLHLAYGLALLEADDPKRSVDALTRCLQLDDLAPDRDSERRAAASEFLAVAEARMARG